MKSAVTIWPPPTFELARSSPEFCSARSCITFCMPTPRSTTMKQFDCWIIMRMSPTGDWRLYRRRKPRIWSCGSTTAIAPIGLSQCSSPLAPLEPCVPAEPWTTLPPCPCLLPVIPWAYTPLAANANAAVTVSTRRDLLFGMDPLLTVSLQSTTDPRGTFVGGAIRPTRHYWPVRLCTKWSSYLQQKRTSRTTRTGAGRTVCQAGTLRAPP